MERKLNKCTLGILVYNLCLDRQFYLLISNLLNTILPTPVSFWNYIYACISPVFYMLQFKLFTYTM